MILLMNCKVFFFFFFYLLGFLFLITALFLILTESPVHSILYLMFIFVYLTEFTLLLKIEFLALIFIIVYIGAVCILMLFHIKLIKTFIHRFDNLHDKNLLVPFVIVSLIIPFLQIITLSFENTEDALQRYVTISNTKTLFILNSIHYNYTHWIDITKTVKSTEILGYLIYNFYFIYLIFGSFILLVAMIGSIYLTLIKNKTKKFQDTEKQFCINMGKTLILWRLSRTDKKKKLKLYKE